MKIVLAFFIAVILCTPAIAQIKTNRSLLEKISKDHRVVEEKKLKHAMALAKQKGWPVIVKTNENIAQLVSVDAFGIPQYLITENNTIAAATTGASKLWAGGSSGLNLSGASNSVKGKMGVWDGGTVMNNHVELTGRVQQKDFPSSVSDHATHVSGTLIASGVNPLAKGMAYAFKDLSAYDFSMHTSEMSAAAAGLLLSNHSYGRVSGWSYNSSKTRWEFYGKWGDNEDYAFGYYDYEAQMWDSMAYNAPYYLIVKSAGNNRSQNGPAEGQPYFRYDVTGQMISAGNRPPGMSSNEGYEIISTYGTAKNVLTVGAVAGIANGYYKPQDVTMSSFSSWGPTDDGRIKPDIVANGVSVLSSTNATTESYSTFSGTSMSAPNATGSLLLLQEYYAQIHRDTFMRAATLKALAIHTADETGDAPGPNYRFGWGLLNVAKAADVIRSNNTASHQIIENALANGQTHTISVVASGKGSLVATIVWTDPKGEVDPVNVLNNPAPKLINDLDLRIIKDSTTYMPWILDPAMPSSQAIKGDNIRDNVERINIDNPIPGKVYTIQINHKRNLERGSQAYSLILSGVGGQVYCATNTSSSGIRIDSVSFAGIKQSNTSSNCTGYTLHTQETAFVEPNQALPFYLSAGSCDASVKDKVAKVFIDLNSNGSFADTGELIATSNTINGSGVFSTTVTIPAHVTPGHTSVMRIVLQETSNANTVNSCANSNAETRDYLIRFLPPANDLSVLELATPPIAYCAGTSQMITLKIRNNGSSSKSNFPISLQVKNGNATIATINTTYPGTIGASDVVNFSVPAVFNSTAGGTYSITAIIADASDQQRSNDSLNSFVSIASSSSPVTGAAEICGTSGILISNASAIKFWYDALNSEFPIGSGSYLTTSTIPADKTYYIGTGVKAAAGLSSKATYANGGGYLTSNASNFMRYTSSVPLVLETARLYSKYGGKVEFIVADITSQTSTSYNYVPLSSTMVDVYTTSPNPAPGAQPGYDATDTGAIFNLNITLPAGDHAIIIKPQGETNLFRNNNVSGNPYPFSVPGVITFHGNSATQDNNPNYFQQFYYYLYNMKLRTANCVSAKTPVVASVAPTPVITMAGDTLMSSIDNGNQWYVDGNSISGANGKKYKPLQSGSYTVAVTDSFACQQTSAAYVHSITAVDPVQNREVNLQIAPNPNNGIFTLSFYMVKRDDLRIDLVNAQGQSVWVEQQSKFQGNYSKTFNLQNFASGMYMLKIQHGSKSYYNKILVQR